MSCKCKVNAEVESNYTKGSKYIYLVNFSLSSPPFFLKLETENRDGRPAVRSKPITSRIQNFQNADFWILRSKPLPHKMCYMCSFDLATPTLSNAKLNQKMEFVCPKVTHLFPPIFVGHHSMYVSTETKVSLCMSLIMWMVLSTLHLVN